MSKYGWAVTAALASAAVAAGCGGGNSVDQASSGAKATNSDAGVKQVSVPAPAAVKQRGKLTTCMDVSFPPMEFYQGSDTSKPVGFDVDLMKAVAGAMGVKAQFTPTSFDGLLPSLSSQRCDVVASGMFVTPERTQSFPAVKYLRSRRVLLVKAGNPQHIESPADLAGKTVVTQSGTQYAAYLKDLRGKLVKAGKKPLRLQTYPKASDAVQQLVVGRAAAVLTQDTEAAYRMSVQDGQFEIAFHYPASDVFGAYYRKDAADIGAAVRSALAKLRANGSLGKLAEKYGLAADGVQL